MRRIATVLTLSALAACSQAEEKTAEQELAPADAIITALDEQRAMMAEVQTPGELSAAYQFVFDGLVLETIPLAAFEGKPILVVNTASKCGYTPQYAGLQELHETYKDQGLVVLGVPSNDFGRQEPGTAEDIEEFCRLNFGVTFPMTQKYVVQGEGAHPFYAFAATVLGEQAVPQWNFHKILVGRDGQPVAAFPSSTLPTGPELTSAIREVL